MELSSVIQNRVCLHLLCSVRIFVDCLGERTVMLETVSLVRTTCVLYVCSFMAICFCGWPVIWSQLRSIEGHCIVEITWQRGWQDRMAGPWQPVAVFCTLLNTKDLYLEQFLR